MQEFAAVNAQDFHKYSYLDIINSILKFVDHLKQAWAKAEAKPAAQRELQLAFLAAAPLQILFGTDCLQQAFELWMQKAEAQATPCVLWDEDAKSEALAKLFALFDTNADGRVDAEELRITLKAFGLELPEDTELHFEVVRHFDGDGDGQMDLPEFRLFVESRIEDAFRLFVEGPRDVQGGDSIVESDLRRVANELGYDSLHSNVYQKMIHILDTEGSERDGMVNRAEFEQLILMRPDPTINRISNVHALNKAVCDLGASSPSRKASRRFAWDDRSLRLPAHSTPESVE